MWIIIPVVFNPTQILRILAGKFWDKKIDSESSCLFIFLPIEELSKGTERTKET